MNVTDVAKLPGATRDVLSRVINGQCGISAEMAIRLEMAGWSGADHWLRLQTPYVPSDARRHPDQLKLEAHRPQPAA